MDIYLPADFHELHDDAVADWRDLSVQQTKPDARVIAAETQRVVERSVDPSWLAI
jgi:hypothetical protein